jgi:hypothetical protein
MPHKTDRENRVIELMDQLDRENHVIELTAVELDTVAGGNWNIPEGVASPSG